METVRSHAHQGAAPSGHEHASVVRQDFAQDLARLYDDALGAAKQQIQKVIAAASLSRRDSGKSAPTFLALDGSRADGFDMQISMVAPHEIAPEVNALVAKIEQKRTALEERLFSEVRNHKLPSVNDHQVVMLGCFLSAIAGS